MPDWKAKLIEMIPEERAEWQDESSIYLAFGTVGWLVEHAAKNGNEDMLRQCFDFAQWCFDQDAKDLWNAAGVSFYEHLADNKDVELIVHQYVKRSTFLKARELLVFMGHSEAVKRITQRYQ